MGSGKSKTGELLARKLGYDFLDTDELIEMSQGKSIKRIFQDSGEEYFRHIEMETLHSLGEKKNVVVATGGGLPCFSNNMEWINAHGISVYLKVPVAMLIQRLLNDRGERPLLQSLTEAELAEKVRKQMESREEYYLASKIVFDIAHQNLNVLIREISAY